MQQIVSNDIQLQVRLNIEMDTKLPFYVDASVVNE
jgi:hypothetical protein